jgi:hypothetical protein
VIIAAVDGLGLSETEAKAKKARMLLSTAMDEMKALAERSGQRIDSLLLHSYRRSDRENLQFSIRHKLEELRLLGNT